MAKKNFLVDIDLNKQELLRARLENLGSHPWANGTSSEADSVGYTYFNTNNKTPYIWDGTQWIDFGTIQGALIFKGGYNAGTNTPDISNDSTILTGYTYVVTELGTFLSADVEVGDMIIAITDNPSNDINNWTVVNKNIDDVLPASKTEAGIIRIADTADYDTITPSDETVVTPAGLYDILEDLKHNELDGLQGGSTNERYHLNQSQWEWVAGQMWENSTVSITNNPSGGLPNGEKGVGIINTVRCTITPNDDTITGAELRVTNASGALLKTFVASDFSGGNFSGFATFVDDEIFVSRTYFLRVFYNGFDGSGNRTATTTYTARIPVWTGTSLTEDFSTTNPIPYATLNSALSKTTPNTNGVGPLSVSDGAPGGEYYWWICKINGANATAIENGSTPVNISPWGSPTGGLWYKTANVLLADGTSESYTLYRKVNPDTLFGDSTIVLT